VSVEKRGSETSSDQAEEIDRLKAEIASLRSQQSTRENRRSGGVRRTIAAVLAILAAVTLAASAIGLWTRRTVTSTDRWVALTGPLGSDPSVTSLLADRVTAQVVASLDIENRVADALPENLALVAGPLTSGATTAVEDQVNNFFASDVWEEIWLRLDRFAHSQAIALLREESEVVQVVGDQVVLNLLPVINEVLAQVTSASPEIFGQTLDLPDVQVDEVPESVITRLESALGTDLPDDFGQIPVYNTANFEQAQWVFERVARGTIVLALIGLFLAALALWVSPSRRRTLLQLSIGTLVLMVIVRRVGLRIEDEIIGGVQDDAARPAVAAVLDAVMSSFRSYTGWWLAALAVIIIVALLTGPYAWARTSRVKTVELSRGLVGGLQDRSTRPATVLWVREHRELLLIAGALIGCLLLLLFNVSFVGLIVILALVVAFELSVVRIASDEQPTPST